MKNNEIKKIMNDNRNDIAKASRLMVGIVLGAVIIIGVVFYGIAPKTKKSDKSDKNSSAVEASAEKSAVVMDDEDSEWEDTRERPIGHLYRVAADTTVTDKSGEYIGAAGEGELFSSYDELEISKFGTGQQIEVEYLSQRGYLLADDLEEVGAATVLPTAGNSIKTDSNNSTFPSDTEDSGFIAAAALVNCQKLYKWDKYELKDAAGTLGTGEDYVKLIEEYSGGDLIAEKKTPISAENLVSYIKEGRRILLPVRYYDGIADFDYSEYYGISSGTQYVVVCGYETEEDGGILFYCCDPFYGTGGRSLVSVSADTLVASAELVDDARKGMIVLR
ncbi:hypothetical protein [Ruminococcus albus]|uniref:Uncharacterized protein n=1 Tax=Ruminococcus albus TaxID=1264 RepID=A0A1H7N8U7_RUMAL|nr:hypothetical protein [Ruminococcus albus]SEL20012.1 hypothetical protein SAMN05216469_11451 [Ruminococcus albus]